MSTPGKSGSSSKAATSQNTKSPSSPRLPERTVKLNPVSAPGLKPVSPPPSLTHLEESPVTKPPCSSSSLWRERQSHTQPEASRCSDTNIITVTRRGREKPAKLVLVHESDTHTGSSGLTSAHHLPSPTAHQNPHGDTSVLAAVGRRKAGPTSDHQPQSLEFPEDKQYPIVCGANALEHGDEDRVSVYGGCSSSRGARILVPVSRDSRSPSPMSRRSKMTGSTLSPSRVSSVPPSTDICGPEERHVSRSRVTSISSTTAPQNPLTTSPLSDQTQLKNVAILKQRENSDAIDSDINPTNRRSRSKGAATASTSLSSAGGNSNKKNSNKIDINFSPASPLSPRKREASTSDTASANDAFQENYRFFLRGGSSGDHDGDDNNNNVATERTRRIFSPAPVRDIFSPMPSVTGAESCYKDILDSCTEINLPSGVVNETKRGSTSGIVFPAIKVENVDDKTDRRTENRETSTLSDSIGTGRRSRSITYSSGSSSSTSPSPTSPPPTEFSRFKPTRAKSTNTLLSAEASRLIDGCLSPTLSPTPPSRSSPSPRHHPEDARLSWCRSGSSSTSCLLSVPPPVIRRQTSEGRLVVGVPDALTVPGEGGAGRKGMKSRGWSRSESNLFVRTGRPVGGAGEGGLRTEDDFEEGYGNPGRSDGSISPNSTRTIGAHRFFKSHEESKQSKASPFGPSLTSQQQYTKQQVPRQDMSPSTVLKHDGSKTDLPVLTSKPVSMPRPSYREN